MTPREINISYGITGDITFTVTWHPASPDDALAAVRDFIARLNGEEKIKPEQKQPKAEPKPKAAPKPAPKPVVKKAMTDRRGFHRWTDDEKREAMRMYQEGEDINLIAEKFHSTPLSVNKIMQRAGVRRPWPTKGNPSKVEAVAEEEPKEEPV